MPDEMWNEIAWQVIVEQSGDVEFDWYGVDRLGHIAAFSSFGHGIIPKAVKNCRNTYNLLYDFIESLPHTTDAKLIYSGPGAYDSWLEYARQGLFAYDYADVHRRAPLGQYDLIAVPLVPIKLSDLKIVENLQAIIPFVDVEFGIEPALSNSVFPQ